MVLAACNGPKTCRLWTMPNSARCARIGTPPRSPRGGVLLVAGSVPADAPGMKESPGRAGAFKELTTKGNPGIKVP